MDDFNEPHKVARLLENLPCRWAVAGGWALDLFLGRVTRKHQDFEVAILRGDQLVLQEYLSSRGWSLEYVHEGKLYPWPGGEWLRSPSHEIWCRVHGPVRRLEVLLNESQGEEFVFRRDSRIAVPLGHAFIRSTSGIPILAPELVLLYKAKRAVEPKEQRDFSNVLDALGAERRQWLLANLSTAEPGHMWLADLG